MDYMRIWPKYKNFFKGICIKKNKVKSEPLKKKFISHLR